MFSMIAVTIVVVITSVLPNLANPPDQSNMPEPAAPRPVCLAYPERAPTRYYVSMIINI